MPLIFLFLVLAQAAASGTAADRCVPDRGRILSLDPGAFDQDLQGGWRAISEKDGCVVAAADLIRDYREAHGSSIMLSWHEGQLRAAANQTDAAIGLFDRSRRGPPDRFGWNHYVDATIAFLRNNRAALLAARASLAALPRPSDFQPRDPQGRPITIAWPMNLKAVDGLIACFGRPYSEAYSPTCWSS